MRRALLVAIAACLLGAALAPIAADEQPAGAGGSGRPKVLILGDSMAIGLIEFMKGSTTPDYDADYRLIDKSDGACNIGRGTLLTYVQTAIPSGACDDWKTRWPGYITQYDPEVVVVITGGWDITDRWSTPPTSCNPGPLCPVPNQRISQAKGNQNYYRKLRDAIGLLRAGGAKVVVVSEPYVNPLEPTPNDESPLPPAYHNIHWEPYPDTAPGPSPEWPAGWRPPTTGATYISSRIKVNALVAQQELVKAQEYGDVKKVSVFSFLDLLSPGGNSYADEICEPVTVPPTTACAPEDKVLVRFTDGYHLMPAGNQIVADAFDARLRKLLKLPAL